VHACGRSLLGGRWGHPLRTGAWLTPYKHATPPRVLSYRIASLYGSNSFGVRRGPKNFGNAGTQPLGMGDVAEPYNYAAPACVTMPHSIMVKPLKRNYGDLPEILTPHAPPHEITCDPMILCTRSLEPTGIDHLPMTSSQ